MSSSDQKLPEWFLWLITRGPVFWTAVLIVCLSGLIGGLYAMSRMNETPDRSYFAPSTPPNSNVKPVELPSHVTSGQRIYVPVYSHVYINEGVPLPMAVTLSIRNVDEDKPLTISRVEYFDTAGKSIGSYLESPIELGPLGTQDFLVSQSDLKGGSGANFMVEWVSDEAVQSPVVQAVMIGSAGNSPVAFTTEGQVLSGKPALQNESDSTD